MTTVLSDYTALVRLDLTDPSGGSARWADADINRAIDKAVTRYSQYYPNVLYSDMATEYNQRTYPYPASWSNSSYPVWWIERILYPLQYYGSYFAPPTSGATLTRTAGAGLSIGTYQYYVTYISQGGETTASPVASVTTTSGNQQVSLTAIPTGPSSTVVPNVATNTVIGRNIYRTAVGGSTFYLLTTIQDNTTTTSTDTTADASITTNPTIPTVNTSGVMYWPPRRRAFSEYGNIFDSNTALASGGNQGTAGAVGTNPGILGQAFTLQLGQSELPQDSTLVMRIFYATKHQLDSSTTTIPAVHQDIITLGACAYCMEAYQIPTNDNFQFQDGAARDRIDDTNIPASWRATAQDKMRQFLTRLEELKRQRDYASSSRIRWGQLPHYWGRI